MKFNTTMHKRHLLYILCTWLAICVSDPACAINVKELADSLNLHYNRFFYPKTPAGDTIAPVLARSATVWVPPVRVRQMRVNGSTVTVRTNATLGGVVFTPEELKQMRRDVSRWVLGHERGKVSIYSEKYELAELVPTRLQKRKEKYPDYTKPDIPCIDCAENNETYKNGMSGRYIALWASHGTYYNAQKDSWIWQRATMWTTVEDLYSTEYVRLISKMIENAGGVVLQPRAQFEGKNFRKNTDGTWCLTEDNAGQETGRSGLPRRTEAARYWLEEAGFPDSVWRQSDDGNEYIEDLRSRGLWVNYLTGGSKANPTQEGLGIPVDVCLALHTDGYDALDDTTIVGTLAIYTDHDDTGRKTFGNGVSRMLNRDLADYVQTQVVEDLQRTIAPEWTRRQLLNGNYCESRYPVVPCVLLELLSHKNMADMRYGLNPEFRMIAARAVYKGLLRYLHEQDGRKVVVQPLAVKQLNIQLPLTPSERGLANTDIVLSWEDTPDPLEPTAKATHYYIYARANDGEWTEKRTEHNHITLPLERGKRYDFYVVAANAGGRSLQSEILSAYFAPDTDAPTALIINNFNQVYGPQWFADSTYAGIVPNTYAVEDRLSIAYLGEQQNWTRQSAWQDDDNCGWGMCYRDYQGTIVVGNTHDYPTLHGRVLQQLGYSYISTNAKALTTIDSTFAIVDVICGKERATDTTAVLPRPLQEAIQQYLSQGGKVLLSGSYLGNGMARPEDRLWVEKVLHYGLAAEKATRSGRIQCTMHNTQCTIRTKPNSAGLFAEAAEGLKPTGEGAQRIAIYQDMRVGAGVLWKGVSTLYPPYIHLTSATLVWGFPLEAAEDFETIYKYSIEQLMTPPAPPQETVIAKGKNKKR